MKVILSQSPFIDKRRAMEGRTIAIAHNMAEAILLSFQETDHFRLWYVMAHLSAQAAESELINEPFYYVEGTGYVKISWDNIAMLTPSAQECVWQGLYEEMRIRVRTTCPNWQQKRCRKSFCPFGHCKRSMISDSENR